MGCSAFKAIWIHDGTVRASVQVVDEVLNNLENWYRWVISMVRETFGSVNEIRAGVLHNMENFSNLCAKFS